MDCDKIASIVKANIEALPAVPPCGARYRVSATLIDGTLLPCVVIEPGNPFVDLAVRRFEEERKRAIAGIVDPLGGYMKIVEAFVTARNCLSHYDIGSLHRSEFAIPLARLREAGGETSTGGTEFYGAMGDGMEFCFEAAFGREFFDMPPGYVATDIQKIVPATRGEKRKYEAVYRERPYFTCDIDGL